MPKFYSPPAPSADEVAAAVTARAPTVTTRTERRELAAGEEYVLPADPARRALLLNLITDGERLLVHIGGTVKSVQLTPYALARFETGEAVKLAATGPVWMNVWEEVVS